MYVDGDHIIYFLIVVTYVVLAFVAIKEAENFLFVPSHRAQENYKQAFVCPRHGPHAVHSKRA